jgi:hypothetical protein
MIIGKNVVGAFLNAFIWVGAALAVFLLARTAEGFVFLTVGPAVLGIAFALSYFILRSLDMTYGRIAQNRVDRFINTLDDDELNALRNRLSGSGVGEYGSLDDLIELQAAKPKRG